MRTRHHRQTIFLGSMVVAVAVVSWARPVYFPSYAEMSSKADLVVLATPVDQRGLPDRATVPGVTRGNDPIAAIQVETTFELQAVLRGEVAEQKTLTLLHYREANPLPKDQLQPNG